MGMFNRIFLAFAAKGGKPDRLMNVPPSQGAPHRRQPVKKKGMCPDVSGALRAT